MSTAATTIGCLAEDYPTQLKQICEIYVAIYAHGALILDERMQANLDVARSFIATVEAK